MFGIKELYVLCKGGINLRFIKKFIDYRNC